MVKILLALTLVVACSREVDSVEDAPPPEPSGGASVAAVTGGATSATTQTGGSPGLATGGAEAVATGGASVATGGSRSTGGARGLGGIPATGGRPTGGSPGTGGVGSCPAPVGSTSALCRDLGAQAYCSQTSGLCIRCTLTSLNCDKSDVTECERSVSANNCGLCDRSCASAEVCRLDPTQNVYRCLSSS